MFSVLTCIVDEHDLRLVVLAALTCALSCSAAFGFHLRSLAAAKGSRLLWLGLTGLVAGCGVWATHFIAMLAYLPQMPIGYAPVTTALSLVTAIVGMGVGFAVPVLQPGRLSALGGGALAGLAVAAMHFMGIDAMRAPADFEWNAAYVVAAVLVGMAGGAAAFYAHHRLKGRAGWIWGATLLLLGIVGLHFTAMTGVRLVPDPALALPEEVVGRGVLVLATVVMTALILMAAVSLVWMERLGRRTTLSGMRDALHAVSSGLGFFDAKGRLLSWNRGYETLMSGAGVVLIEGMVKESLITGVLTAGWEPQIDIHGPLNAPAPEGRVGLELKLPDGRWMRHETFQTQDGGGVSVMTDITQQQETNRAMAQARDAAEAANRAKSQFLANISHEIRTPLNGVLGVADVLINSDLTPKQHELVGVIRTSGALLNSLLTDLLDLARVEAGAVELRPEPAALGDLVHSVGSLYAARAGQKGVTLVVEIAPGADSTVACDAMRLRQVLGNLVSNAVKFTDAGEVTLLLGRQGDRVTFQVRDTGPGFDDTLKATLFGRFEQADDSSTRKHGGAGLGLAICREYVALMGGELDCESQLGVGSTFAFTLDLPALPEAEAEAAMAVMSAVAIPDQPGRFRVLVVDDNEINRQVLGLILDSAGIDYADAEDGQAGVEAAVTGRFDAVLMDIQMPVMDGFEATRRIRAWETDAGRPRMPIYIVSANGLQEHVDAGIAAGADGHLNKPVSIPLLLGTLEPHVNAALAA
ncbi:MAG: response regulator [Alphaproteobacteria bacterium]|nr:response regulator [Alphaproteobacteria bacterium]MBU1515310.1 response regulator [Alphaproteobacteria bacterium]MBU2094950.1 response regulator [Alphaproteobacteria bacterium]MBU2149625.1 response regulator [Alphaproteobacteria bacterium]MBU2310016.1 response regulator [Alphaproteobacteria bacterium]